MDPEIEERCEAAAKKAIKKARARRQALIEEHNAKVGAPAAKPAPAPKVESGGPSVAEQARTVVANNPDVRFSTLLEFLVAMGVKKTTARGALVRALAKARGGAS